ncbi:MAG: MotA/TolQ/ExbB proton channel family protein [Phycisphaerales bacterium]|jgi:biopolymer transport protein ExbB|nr:MotA/TolQ/ExbB proton channel family protein [Phycisphaerales bacterium]
MYMLAAAGDIDYFNVLMVQCGTIGWILWLMSIITVAIVVQYFIAIRRENILPPAILEQVRELFDEKQYGEAIEMTADEPSFLSYVVHAGLSDASHGYPAMERAMEESAEERTTKYLRQIEWLNLIGNISPMLGLLGTVWGMILAFQELAASGGTADPADLADSIGIALVTTLLGLAIAIPSLAVYAVMRNRVDALTSEAMVAGQDLISTFRPA